MSKESSRRKFIKKTALAGSAAMILPTLILSSAFGANDRINAAVLGLNGRREKPCSRLHVSKGCAGYLAL
jgi:hypothetical protein